MLKKPGWVSIGGNLGQLVISTVGVAPNLKLCIKAKNQCCIDYTHKRYMCSQI